MYSAKYRNRDRDRMLYSPRGFTKYSVLKGAVLGEFMRIAIVGQDTLSKSVATRLEQEGFQLHMLAPDPQSLQAAYLSKPYDVLVALTNDDETNLVTSALVKQLGPVKTIASLKKREYIFQREVDIHRAFHVDHVLFPDLLVVDKIAESIFEEGIYSRSFLHGNVLLRTMRVADDAPFAGHTLAEIRQQYPQMLICLIHRPHKILATSQNRSLALMGTGDELIFAHGKDLVLPEDEITMLGETEAVLQACKSLASRKMLPHAVSIVGANTIGQALVERVKKHNLTARLEAETIPSSDFSFCDVFVACHEDEEHNFVLALQAKDHGVGKVIAVLSDRETCLEAEKLGITHINATPYTAQDRVLELIQGGKVTSVMSLYDARAEILQVSIDVNSSIVGIPLSALGPTLPQEILIGVIYTRGRIFIAGGTHILKPQDECLVIASPKHRSLLEKIL